MKNYFSNLKPETKQEGELRAFRELKIDFDPAEIEKALNYLKIHGDLRKGEKCHSPMAYLTRAITDVMREVEKNKQIINAKQIVDERKEFDQREVELEKREAAKQWEKASNAFRVEILDSDDQQEIIFNYTRKYFQMLDPNGEMVKKLSIQRWYEEEFLNQKAVNHA